jgi:prevent-host-death family protein
MLEHPVAATWTLTQAKLKLGDLIDDAVKGVPQVVTRHGRLVAVIVSADEYDRLRSPPKTLLEFRRSAPTAGLEFRIKRDRASGRAVSP